LARKLQTDSKLLPVAPRFWGHATPPPVVIRLLTAA
jgi:hypothetical protein